MSEDHSGKSLMVIDTDCGIDDALALLLALSYSDSWKIIAITCCHGNTTVDNACNNVLKTLHLCRRSNIPVYRGCESPLVPLTLVKTGVHGSDGLGDVAHEYSSGELKISEEHAVNALVRLAKEYKQKLHLVALAPLTNIAMAHRIDPEFTANLKSFVLMGGNIIGIGNTTTTAEFNFAVDPEAAHVVMSEALCPTTMVPWETAIKCNIPWEEHEDLIRGKTPKASFLNKITKNMVSAQRSRGRPGFVIADFLAIADLVVPGSTTETEVHPVSVETAGMLTRGQAVIHRRLLEEEESKKPRRIVTGMNRPLLLTLLKKTVIND